MRQDAYYIFPGKKYFKKSFLKVKNYKKLLKALAHDIF